MREVDNGDGTRDKTWTVDEARAILKRATVASSRSIDDLSDEEVVEMFLDVYRAAIDPKAELL